MSSSLCRIWCFALKCFLSKFDDSWFSVHAYGQDRTEVWIASAEVRNPINFSINVSSDLSSPSSIIVGRAGWVRGISPYLQQSLGAPPVRVPTSKYTLSALPWGPTPASPAPFHSPRFLSASLKEKPAEELSPRSNSSSWAVQSGGESHSCLGSQVHEGEVPYLPCFSQGHLLITNSSAPGPFLGPDTVCL